jgi:acetyl-CoA acetyltransferase
MRRFFSSFLMMASLALPCVHAKAAEGETPRAKTVAVIDFAYIDTSGESRDQSAEHQARLAAFMAALRADLDKSGVYRAVAPKCGSGPCSVNTPAENLLAAAREAKGDIVLVGGVHKMSTLVQWAEIETFDAASGRSLGKKLFTFRGDTDEAWRRAEKFIIDEVLASP